MKKTPAMYKRTKMRMMPYIAWSIFGIFLVVLVFFVVRSVVSPFPYRINIVVVGNPIHIVSWNAKKDKITLLDLPADVSINAIHGYGVYSAASLFQLDHIDNMKGKAFIGSVSDALGIPVAWYAAPGTIADGAGDIAMIRSIFSWSSIWSIATRQTDTTIPVGTWVSFVIAAQSLSADSVDMVSTEHSYISSRLPDGSRIRELDESRFDYTVGTAFLDSGIRAEGLTISVYNTTPVASIGQHAARVMSKVGMQLVFVGNASPERTSCVVRGSSRALASKTARFLRDYFACISDDSDSQKDAAASDLRVLLGTRYASQFLSSQPL